MTNGARALDHWDLKLFWSFGFVHWEFAAGPWTFCARMVDLPPTGVKPAAGAHETLSGMEAIMNEQQTILTRLGNWLRRTNRDGDLPLHGDNGNGDGDSHQTTSLEPRSTFLRPWARRDAAINHLQEGFGTLTDLMSTIRQTLDGQTRRQDELLTYLAHLPEAIQSLPETSRIHSETLRAIHQQLEQQNMQQERLAEILGKMSQSGGEQREAMKEVRQQMDSIRQTDETISSNLNSLGSALQNVSQNSTTGAQVLQQMREQIDTRDGQLEKILTRQGTRFTTMLAIAIFLSISALAAVCVMGYMLIVQK
jgi:methyl-accepting chemotaxis protein